MDLRKLLSNALKKQETALDTVINEGRAMTTEELEAYNVLQVEITNLEATIAIQDARTEREAVDAVVVTRTVETPVDDGRVLPFKNFAEQLFAVKKAAYGSLDPRLTDIQNAALGGNEGVPSEGGYLVQQDFAQDMMDSAAKSGQILPLVDRYEITGNANRVTWVEVDETTVATTVFGGVQVYWAAEAADVTASKPKLLTKELKLEKLMGIAYATFELEADSNFTNQLYTRAFTLAIQRELESCIVSGNGAGKPLGFLNGGALIAVDKEAEQTADTVVYYNLVKMFNRVINKAAKGLVWLCHPDVRAQFDFMSFPVGTGGLPLFLPESRIGDVATMKSKPIIETDQCSALGDEGDISLVDLNQYMLITKGGVISDTSIHVQFLTAENCFRFIFRANGMPKTDKTFLMKNTTVTRSAFVTLAERT